MGKTAEELWREGCNKVYCVEDGGLKWWTIGKTYTFNDDGFLTDDDGDVNDTDTAKFEPYSFFGMKSKEFTHDEMNQLAQMVAEKVIAILKEKMK